MLFPYQTKDFAKTTPLILQVHSPHKLNITMDSIKIVVEGEKDVKHIVKLPINESTKLKGIIEEVAKRLPEYYNFQYPHLLKIYWNGELIAFNYLIKSLFSSIATDCNL